MISKTLDGSDTLYSNQAGETYHSTAGAVLEAMHVYVSPTFNEFKDKSEIKILEIGFGTGLNALITYIESQKTKTKVYYETIEPYPIGQSVYENLNYPDILNCDNNVFLNLHKFSSGYVSGFSFVKKYVTVDNFLSNQLFDAIYFDAFSPHAYGTKTIID